MHTSTASTDAPLALETMATQHQAGTGWVDSHPSGVEELGGRLDPDDPALGEHGVDGGVGEVAGRPRHAHGHATGLGPGPGEARLLTATTGLARAASRTMRVNLRGLPNESK